MNPVIWFADCLKKEGYTSWRVRRMVLAMKKHGFPETAKFMTDVRKQLQKTELREAP